MQVNKILLLLLLIPMVSFGQKSFTCPEIIKATKNALELGEMKDASKLLNILEKCYSANEVKWLRQYVKAVDSCNLNPPVLIEQTPVDIICRPDGIGGFHCS